MSGVAVAAAQNEQDVPRLSRFALILDSSPAEHEAESSWKTHELDLRVEYARRSQEGTLVTAPSELGRFAQPTAASLGQQDDSRTEQEQTMFAQRRGRDLIAVDSRAHAQIYASRQGAGQLATLPDTLGHVAQPTQAWQASLFVDRLDALTPTEQATYMQRYGRSNAHIEGSAHRDAWEWRQKNGALSTEATAAQLRPFAKDTASSLTRASSMNRKEFSTQAELSAYEEQRIRTALAAASSNERNAWVNRQTKNKLATVPDNLGRFSTNTINWRSYTSSADNITKTQKQLEWDGGNRRNLHHSLSQASEAYHARPSNSQGVPLPTSPIKMTLATETRAQERATSKSQLLLPSRSTLDEIGVVDWKRAQEVRLLWEKRMRHVSRGQQLYNNNNHHHHHSFHKRPSDIPEGAEDATEGSSKDFLSDKKKTKTQKTFKRHHGWMTPLTTLRQPRSFEESTDPTQPSSPPALPLPSSSSSSSSSSWWRKTASSVPRTTSSLSSSPPSSVQPSLNSSPPPLNSFNSPNPKAAPPRSSMSRFFRSALRPSSTAQTGPTTSKDLSSTNPEYQPIKAQQGHPSSTRASFQGRGEGNGQSRTKFQLRMKASKEREHRQNHAGEEDNGSLQPSPIVRPSSAKGICTPPRKLAGAGTRNIQVREFSPDSSSPPSFRGVSAAREFQAAIRRDVLFLEQQHHTSSNSSSNSTSIGPSNVMRTRTRSTSSASSTSSSSSSSSGRSEAREFVRHDGRFIGKDGIVIAPGVRLADRSRPTTPIASANQDSPIMGTTI